MQQYEQIVDDILTILMADVDPAEAALRDADRRYSEAAAELNERLIRCDKLLHKGHRAEALQECEREPNLLDALAVLDFPEAEQWGEYVRQFGLAGPPALRTDIGLDLNDAYTTDSELAGILRQHRLLALARAPLTTRLKTLRQIARQDAGNPIWLDDVRSWEQVRHTQLPRELEGAVAAEDLPTMTQLVQEVRSREWTTPPPEAVTKRIVDAHKTLSVKQARRQLDGLEKELTAAYADYDVHRARKVRERWNNLATAGLSGHGDPLLERATPALEWLLEQDRQDREQQQHAAAVTALGAALDNGASQRELERLTHALLACGQGLPEDLEQRLQDRFADLEKSRRRRTIVVLASIVMSVLLLAGLTAWWIYARGQNQLVAGHERNLGQLIDAGRLDAARSYAEELQKNSPALYRRPEVQNRVKGLEAAQAEERARREHFAQLLQDARKLGQTAEGQGQAEAKLDDAEKLVEQAPEERRHPETQEIDAARAELSAGRREQQAKVNDAWLAEFNAWSQACAQLERSDAEQIQRLLTDGDGLAKRPKVDAQVRNQIQPKLDELRKDYDRQMSNRTETELLQAVAEAVGDRPKFVRSLQTYVGRLPDSPRAADFRQVLENELTFWDGVEAWTRLTDRWAKLQLNQVSPAQAGELITEAEALLKQHGGFPAAAAVQQIVGFLRPIRARIKEDGSRLEADLVPDLDVPPVKDFHIVWHGSASESPKRYYFLDEPPQLLNRSIKFDHLVDNMGEVRAVELSRPEVQNPVQGRGYDWTSPQQQFYDFLAAQLPQVETSWESTFFAIIRQLYAEPNRPPQLQMEPILKIELLDRVLQTACAGSHAVQVGFGPWGELIAKARDDGRLDLAANWVDPEDRGANRARAAALRLLENMGPIEVASTRAGQAWKELLAGRTWEQHRWVGCLLRDGARNWTCAVPPSGTPPAGDLVVFHGASGAAPTVTKVGRLEAGRPALTLSGAQVEGRPVFVIVGP